MMRKHLILLLSFAGLAHGGGAHDGMVAMEGLVDNLVAYLVDSLYEQALPADMQEAVVGKPMHGVALPRTGPMLSKAEAFHGFTAPFQPAVPQLRRGDCGIACATIRNEQPQPTAAQTPLNRRHALASAGALIGGWPFLLEARAATKSATKTEATTTAAPTKKPKKVKSYVDDTPSTTKGPKPKRKPKPAPAPAAPAAGKGSKPSQGFSLPKAPVKTTTTTTTTTLPKPETGFQIVRDGNDFIQFKDARVGSGDVVTKDDEVTIEYRIDSRPLPFIVPSSRSTKTIRAGKGDIIKGLDFALLGTKGFPAMKQGGDRTVIIPPALAFGNKGGPGVGPGSEVQLKMKVVSVQKKKPEVKKAKR